MPLLSLCPAFTTTHPPWLSLLLVSGLSPLVSCEEANAHIFISLSLTKDFFCKPLNLIFSAESCSVTRKPICIIRTEFTTASHSCLQCSTGWVIRAPSATGFQMTSRCIWAFATQSSMNKPEHLLLPICRDVSLVISLRVLGTAKLPLAEVVTCFNLPVELASLIIHLGFCQSDTSKLVL